MAPRSHIKFIFTLLLTLLPISAYCANESISSFSKAKKILEKKVYPKHRTTIYCNARFDAKKNVIPLKGFQTTKHIKRAKRIEWEHVVPAENFGRTFSAWRSGDKMCVSSKGKAYKGRRCANKVDAQYRYMQADMYNLYPAIGAVNAMRSNYNFQMLAQTKSMFGSCQMKISNRKAEPPEQARGKIARTYLYMDNAYPHYNMSKSQRKLMTAWDKTYPVSAWECQRSKMIQRLQGSRNTIMESRCSSI
ncbi:putative endonuclease I [Psychromonas sp. CNPT3]|uniref:endonuclease n=1 Tax=Psychromonas sp. CNPT3 TaxID=314282 RepID=UPI00006E4888|nr:endonuclease [Psychromonas sp. CNPT3]AGH80997.1 putative endonuclease I [Psychromonas sp. CNPT3]